MNYFETPYVSNSELKRLVAMAYPKGTPPGDLTEIYDFGTLVENVIFQPHLANWDHKDIERAKEMSKTFYKDPMCSTLVSVPDFRRQHEWYRSNCYGLYARCKADGDSKKLSAILEFKGLSITTESAFEEAIDFFDYDQGIAWYLDVARYKQALVVACSKKATNKLFKRLVNREHVYYKRGIHKIKKAVNIRHQYIGDVRIINHEPNLDLWK